ncbi:hypothetical protein HOF46_03525 [Candidatus Woesearchaeota archaeon]|mgnify:CR=1 FL=1|jgi:hypothetical protein|nr:hypothetical protein [Candidatus Woesearchaeota archaeon]MBT4114244.1 hypothetical protein [Candidatus Woesearchaeota archaeon]
MANTNKTRYYEVGPHRELFKYSVRANKADIELMLPEEPKIGRGIYVRKVGDLEGPREIVGTLSIDTTTQREKQIDFCPLNRPQINMYGSEIVNWIRNPQKNNGSRRDVRSLLVRSGMLSMARVYVFVHGAAFLYNDEVYILHGDTGTGKSKILHHLMDNFDVKVLSDSYLPIEANNSRSIKVYPQAFPETKIQSISTSGGEDLERMIETVEAPLVVDRRNLHLIQPRYFGGASPEIHVDDTFQETLERSARYGLHYGFMQFTNHALFSDTVQSYLRGSHFTGRVNNIAQQVKDAKIYVGSEKDIELLLDSQSFREKIKVTPHSKLE